MSTNNSDLVEQFAIETQQHLDEIEPILFLPEGELPDQATIAALFRGFHSIKGLARVLGLRGLEALAHHTESLLAEVRSARQPFTLALRDLLLESLDAIRTLREHGIVGGLDERAPPALLNALEAALHSGAKGATLNDASPQVPEGALHPDAETLTYFAEMLADCLPGLAVLAGVTGWRDQAVSDLEMLLVAAEKLAFHGLSARLYALAPTVDPANIEPFAAVIADARRFGRLIEQDVGAEAALAAIAPLLRLTRAEIAADLLPALGLNATEARTLTARLVTIAAAGLSDGEISLNVMQSLDAPAVYPALRAALETLVRGGSSGSDDLLELAGDRLREAIAAPWVLSPPVRKLLEDRGIAPALLGDLSQDRIGPLLEILAGSERRLLLLTLALPVRGARADFLAWLNQRFFPTAARAFTQSGVDVAALLVVSADAPRAIRADILAAYPDLAFVDTRVLIDDSVETPWSPPRTANKIRGSDPADNQVRVPVEILDRLFGRIGEFFSISSALNVLIVDSQVPTILHKLADHAMIKEPALLPMIDTLQRQQNDLSQVEAEVHRLVSLIHEATLGLRVIPLDIVFNRFPRMVREFAKEEGKQIRFEARADGIKVDKGMTELLADPLMHMLRNAVDHGIESAAERAATHKPPLAHIRLSAEQLGNRIVIEIRDDGRGIDSERVRRRAVAQGLVTDYDSRKLSVEQINRFIFAPGFSTADKVSETSGRGVGMDVVLINISRLGGRIDVRTVVGQGAIFRLDMPLSAAMQTVLLAETSVQTVAFPERMVVEAATVQRDTIQYVNGQRAILHHDRFLPLFGLTDLLHIPAGVDREEQGDLSVIIVSSGRFRYGVEVTRILRRHEMLIRETHPRIAQLPGIGGVSTLGTDRIVLVVDPEGLTDLARRAIVPGMRVPSQAAE